MVTAWISDELVTMLESNPGHESLVLMTQCLQLDISYNIYTCFRIFCELIFSFLQKNIHYICLEPVCKSGITWLGGMMPMKKLADI